MGLILTCDWGKGTLTTGAAFAHGVTGDTGFNPLILQSSMLTNESWDLVTSYFCSISCPCFYSYQRRGLGEEISPQKNPKSNRAVENTRKPRLCHFTQAAVVSKCK